MGISRLMYDVCNYKKKYKKIVSILEQEMNSCRRPIPNAKP